MNSNTEIGSFAPVSNKSNKPFTFVTGQQQHVAVDPKKDRRMIPTTIAAQ